MIKDFNMTYGTTHYKNGVDVKTITVTGSYNDKPINVVIDEEVIRSNWKVKGGKTFFEDYLKENIIEQLKKIKNV